MESVRPAVTGAALALVVGVLYLVCAVAVVLFPDSTVNLLSTRTHGIDLSLIRRPVSRPRI
jgi:hypothetical protein